MNANGNTQGIGSLGCFCIDCEDPAALAAFYLALLGGKITDDDPEWHELTLPNGAVMAFQQVERLVPPRWPDPEAPQQYHLDVEVADMDAAQDAALAAGARIVDERGREPHGFRVLADPAGHTFCLCRSAPAKLADRGRPAP
ncbi:hypothetical protein BIV57_16040 [Mangrovactinospora gilvigrisea]|uniref:VOC domain-containing protein n=1 Tax=Mangrovactinospora gilvigrisea TaxID=1428644 RepID=A0A1J7BCR7_9ACTN|nr:VOC family protein [Mangrovactinospora gilvigrisea]OIV36475.1 hypothetical protein BIV57_16040 [Mangrovactinospora gilvigrisea]